MRNETLGTALPALIAKVRDEILPLYVELGPTGAIGAALIRADLDRASKAMIEGDLTEMIAAYQELKGIKA